MASYGYWMVRYSYSYINLSRNFFHRSAIVCVQLTFAHSALFTPLLRDPRKEKKPSNNKASGESEAESSSEVPRRDAKAPAESRGARVDSPHAKGTRETVAPANALPTPPAAALSSGASLELHSELFDWCSKQFLRPLTTVPAANDPESLANCTRRARYQYNANVNELGVSECASISTFLFCRCISSIRVCTVQYCK